MLFRSVSQSRYEVGVDSSNLGRNFYAVKDNYNFTDSDMLAVIGERMCYYAALAKKGYDAEVIYKLGLIIRFNCSHMGSNGITLSHLHAVVP